MKKTDKKILEEIIRVDHAGERANKEGGGKKNLQMKILISKDKEFFDINIIGKVYN